MSHTLKSLREAHGFASQAALAEAAGVTQPTISMLEQGKHRGSIGTLIKLATAIGVPLDDVVKATERPTEAATPAP